MPHATPQLMVVRRGATPAEHVRFCLAALLTCTCWSTPNDSKTGQTNGSGRCKVLCL